MARLSGPLDLQQNSADPATPQTGRSFLYFKSDGLLYSKAPGGAVTGPYGSGGGAGANVVVSTKATAHKMTVTTAAAMPASPAIGDIVIISDQNGVGGLVEPYVVNAGGTLTVVTGKSRIYLEGNYTVETIRTSVNTAPTGAAVIVDVNKNGTTIFTTQANRPTIAVSGFLSTVTAPDVTTFAAGDYITVDIDQIGSTVAGADLVVTIRLRRV